MAWTKQYPANIVPSGDTVRDVLEKHRDELTLIYSYLNRLRTFDRGTTAPSDPDTNSVWADDNSSPAPLKSWNGSSWNLDFRVKEAESADSATDADTVDGIHASATPTPDYLLPLDSNAKLPHVALDLSGVGFINLVRNGTFQSWSQGTSDVPDKWTLTWTYSTATTWAASTAYSSGDIVIPTAANGFSYKCTVSGTSGASEPTWPTTVGDTVMDGTVTWECIGATAIQDTDGSVKLTAADDTDFMKLSQNLATWYQLSNLQGKTVNLKVYLSTSSTTAFIKINDGVTFTQTNASGTGVMEELSVEHTVDGSATKLDVAVGDTTANAVINVYKVQLYIGDMEFAYQENPLDRALEATYYQDTTPTNYEYRGLRVECFYVDFGYVGSGSTVAKTITYQRPFRKIINAQATISNRADDQYSVSLGTGGSEDVNLSSATLYVHNGTGSGGNMKARVLIIGTD